MPDCFKAGGKNPDKSELNRVCGQIFLNHESNFEDDSMVKFSQVKTCQLLDFFESVHESISVYEKLSGSL